MNDAFKQGYLEKEAGPITAAKSGARALKEMLRGLTQAADPAMAGMKTWGGDILTKLKELLASQRGQQAVSTAKNVGRKAGTAASYTAGGAAGLRAAQMTGLMPKQPENEE